MKGIDFKNHLAKMIEAVADSDEVLTVGDSEDYGAEFTIELGVGAGAKDEYDDWVVLQASDVEAMGDEGLQDCYEMNASDFKPVKVFLFNVE